MEPEPERLSFSLFPLILLAVPSLDAFPGLFAVLILLACSALISGSEIAFFSLTNNDYNAIQQESDANSKRIMQLIERPRLLLATILISNNFINIAIVILSDFVLLAFVPETTFELWAQALMSVIPLQKWFTVEQIGIGINFLIITVGITFLLVLFGEVTPKVYAKINNIQLARFMALPLTILSRLFSPVSFGLVRMTKVIERRLANSNVANSSPTSREDIDDAIELTVSMEEDTEQEVDILKSIVKFGEVSVKQIMRSRVDVVAIDFRESFSAVLKVVRDSGFSRIPIYENDFDNVTGILYVKDLLGYVDEPDQFEWQELIRTNILYVPEAKKIDDLLKEFQRQRLHLAIVVDEYGGSSGIVTLEDIMEEIIGDIQDEFDDEVEILYQRIDDHTFLFEGKTLINDVCRVLNLDTALFEDARGDADSLAGLLLELHGGIPKIDEEIFFQDFTFKVTAATKRRIEQVLLTLPGPLKYYQTKDRS